MVSSAQRPNDRTAHHYTMKTGLPPPSVSSSHAHAYSQQRPTTQSFFPSKPSSTPLTSPRAPYSVGQSTVPKLSPGVHRPTAQDARTPSPNYFGLAIESTSDLRDSSLLPRENWSPSTSSVKSFAAAVPKPLPLDANPEFEAFRRQADMNRGKSDFNLSTAHFSITTSTSHPSLTSTPSAAQRPHPPRWHTHGSDASDAPLPRLGVSTKPKGAVDGSIHAETDSLKDSAYGSADSKRNSEASLNPPLFPTMSRHESPASLDPPFPAPDRGRFGSCLSQPKDRRQCLSLAQERTATASPAADAEPPRAESLPARPESASPEMISPAELRGLLEGDQAEDILVLDLRVSPQFAQSRVKGALNLCIPTTLLKRATFNLQKLQLTFQSQDDQKKFAGWRDASYLVVYDGSSSNKRDAISAMNMIKKFANEGYSGSASILRGGFSAFAAAYPQLIDTSSGRAHPGLSLGAGPTASQLPGVAPVIGGVMLPNMTSKPNPFFSNIRQNQDLVDGVGQMDIKMPPAIDVTRLPKWLREAAEVNNHGKMVADKFLRIELTEQSRMKDAYSISSENRKCDSGRVQLSGIEQGGKNRYKDILPFEHARVRLQGRPEGTCDYVNASHIQAKRSHKRYIASQGPLPATFEDFWSVVWDHDVRVIVMLTAESEGGQLKCHPYWKGNDYGPIRLRVMSEKKVSLEIDKHRSDSSTTSTSAAASTGSPGGRNGSQAEAGRRRANTTTEPGRGGLTHSGQTTTLAETPHVIVRKFALSHASHPFLPMREITQLHYPSWPDFGAPAQPSHLLALIELANVMQRSAQPVGASGALAGLPSQQHSAGINAVASTRYTRNSRNLGIGEVHPLNSHDEPESEGQARPMLVHCSAGCGRTGTFCTVDSVIDMIKRQRLWVMQRTHKRIDGRDGLAPHKDRAKRQASSSRDLDGDVAMVDSAGTRSTPGAATNSQYSSASPSSNGRGSLADSKIDTSWLDNDNIDLIAQTVEDFRSQRLSMVQSLRQFVLCYETVIEWICRLQEYGAGGDTRGRARSGSLAV